MSRKGLILSAVLLALATTTVAYAKGQFKTGIVSAAQAKQMHGSKLTNVASNQLYICNMTNLPNQAGTTIQVSFPQAGVAAQSPAPGSCAYLSNDNGSFTTQVVIDAPAGSNNAVFNNNMSSGEMWSVTYDSGNNTYPVAQIQ